MVLSRVFSFSFVDSSGIPLDGGEMWTYLSDGTEVLTYKDPDGESVNTNPIILDSRGCADIYIDSSKSYRFVVVNRTTGSVEWDVDKYSVPSGSNTGFDVVKASVDASVGIPSVDVNVDGSVLNFSFHNLRGVQGERGAKGEKGDKGDKGDTGATGAAGAKGATGAKGEKGEKGEKGDKGDKGIDGKVIPAWAYEKSGIATSVGYDGFTILNGGVFSDTDGSIITIDKLNGFVMLQAGIYAVSYITNIFCIKTSTTLDDVQVALVDVNTGYAVDVAHTMTYDSSVSKNIKFDCATEIIEIGSDNTPVMLGAQVTGTGSYNVSLVHLSIMKIG